MTTGWRERPGRGSRGVPSEWLPVEGETGQRAEPLVSGGEEGRRDCDRQETGGNEQRGGGGRGSGEVRRRETMFRDLCFLTAESRRRPFTSHAIIKESIDQHRGF